MKKPQEKKQGNDQIYSKKKNLGQPSCMIVLPRTSIKFSLMQSSSPCLQNPKTAASLHIYHDSRPSQYVRPSSKELNIPYELD